MWDDPHRNTWVNKLNLAIYKAGRPVILVAHSLACHVVAWWNEYERPGADSPVLGALLVAPPEVEQSTARSADRPLRAGHAHALCRSPRSSPRAATIPTSASTARAGWRGSGRAASSTPAGSATSTPIRAFATGRSGNSCCASCAPRSSRRNQPLIRGAELRDAAGAAGGGRRRAAGDPISSS